MTLETQIERGTKWGLSSPALNLPLPPILACSLLGAATRCPLHTRKIFPFFHPSILFYIYLHLVSLLLFSRPSASHLISPRPKLLPCTPPPLCACKKQEHQSKTKSPKCINLTSPFQCHTLHELECFKMHHGLKINTQGRQLQTQAVRRTLYIFRYSKFYQKPAAK